MGATLEQFDLTNEDYGGLQGKCHEALVLNRPDVIQGVHESMLEAGAEVLETDTFQASRLKLEEWGLGEHTLEINTKAAQIAREAAGEQRFVAGSIGPTGHLPASDDPTLGNIRFRDLGEVFTQQAQGLIEGGADLLIIETAQDILEVKAAIFGAREAFEITGRKVPIQTSVSLLPNGGKMLLGTDIQAVLTTLSALDVDVVGLNCSTGPEDMRDAIRFLGENSPLPVHCIPNAGLPLQGPDGETIFPEEPDPLANTLQEFVERYGVSIVGGCCGTTPEHIAAIVDRVGGREAGGRPERDLSLLSSMMTATPLVQEPAPTLVGERVNSQGSRKAKELLLADDYDGLVQVAEDQVTGGAHVLDVCVALTERQDEDEQMRQVVKRVSLTQPAPIQVDSTEPDVIEKALEQIPGRAIVNSINLEAGRDKLDVVAPLAKAHGAALIALTIDEVGMAKTADRKVEIAQRIKGLACDEHGLHPEALIFDALTFTLTTGDEEWRPSAVETIEGIRRIKAEIPGVKTSLGVSNVSFGVSPGARAVLNSVFLHHCVEAGLDLAMVNPNHITPYGEIPENERELADDLVFNRRDDALEHFIGHFESKGQEAADEKADPTEGMEPEEALHWHILRRKKDGVEDWIDRSVEKIGAVPTLNKVLLPAMKEVGDKFGAGELILPFVLQSAEVMKRAVAQLENYLERIEGHTKGRVVIATVFGDVHDIGKSLVNTILTNNGYTVVDLGKQVPVDTIISAAQEHDATAIGLSALLVSTSKQMPLCVQELHQRGLSFPVLVGGAAINKQYGQRISFIGDEEPYEPGVFYCKDAFEGLETMDKLSDPLVRAGFVHQAKADAVGVLKQKQRGRTALADLGKSSQSGEQVRSNTRRDVPVPTPPFWGTQVVTRIKLQDVVDCMDRNALYRLQWGAKNAKGVEWEKLKSEFDIKVREYIREAERDGWLEPKVIYGYFPVQSSGNELIVYDPASLVETGSGGWGPEAGKGPLPKPLSQVRELTRFVFPRQPERERLSLADYFRSTEDGQFDVAAFQIVTMGTKVDDLTEQLQISGDYSRGYFIHGLSVSLAEGLAEYTNRVVRQGLGLKGEAGKRYSWGYPACPDLDEHSKLFAILPADQIGVTLTDAFQLVPEQSTAAIVIHHPEAKYFSIGSARERAEGDVEAVAA